MTPNINCHSTRISDDSAIISLFNFNKEFAVHFGMQTQSFIQFNEYSSTSHIIRHLTKYANIHMHYIRPLSLKTSYLFSRIPIPTFARFGGWCATAINTVSGLLSIPFERFGKLQIKIMIIEEESSSLPLPPVLNLFILGARVHAYHKRKLCPLNILPRRVYWIHFAFSEARLLLRINNRMYK